MKYSRIALLCAVAMTAGCVAVDSNVRAERPAKDSLTRLVGRFSNRPEYQSSNGGLLGPNSISEALGLYLPGSRPPESVELSYSPSAGLTATFLRGGQIVRTLELSERQGLKQDGEMLVLHETECGGGEGLGCATTDLQLFVNGEDRLVVVSSGSGGGFFTVMPFWMHTRLMSTFRRAK